MITATDLSLTQEQWENLRDEYGDPIAQFLLEGYALSISEISDPAVGTGTYTTPSLDACVANGTLVRCWLFTDAIRVGTLASEDSADQSWTESDITATGVDLSVPPSIVSSGATVRIFYYDGTNIEYFESTDSGATWGSAQQVVAMSEVYYVAAATINRVHYARRTAQDNLRLGVVEYDSAWETTDSQIYWPLAITSFDAVAMNVQVDDAASAANDIIAASTDFPPLTRIRVDGTELVRNLERVQGIAVFRYQNGHWSDHYEVDVLDRVASDPSRSNVRLSTNGGYVFMTYNRIDGSTNYPHESLAITRSGNGIYWEMPYLIPGTADPPAVLLIRGIHAYLVDSTGSTLKSYLVGYTGGAGDEMTHDMTDYLLAGAITHGDIKQLTLTVGNPQGILDTTLDQTTMWQMRLSGGWVVDGTERYVQLILADMESGQRSRVLPTDYRILNGRDAMGRMTMLRADLIQEWENWQAGGDNFQSLDGTKYSGLIHTAGYQGSWEANDNELQLRSGSEPGIAFNTQCRNVWNGSFQAGVKVAATDSDDYVGLIFRGLDMNNFWYLVYDAENDQLLLNERKNNEDVHSPALAGKTGMGWTYGTWYYLKVSFRYNYVSVFTSTDGATWSNAIGKEQPGVVTGASFTFNAIPNMRGYNGYYGHGYSAENPSNPDPPYDPIPIPDPDLPDEWPSRVLVATANGVYLSEDFTGPDGEMPTWSDVTGDLPIASNGGTGYIRKLAVDYVAPYDHWYVQLDDNHSNTRAVYRSEDQGSNWELIFESTDAGNNRLADIAIDRTRGGYFYVLVESSNVSIYESDSYGDDGTFSAHSTDVTAWHGVCGLQVHGGIGLFWRSRSTISGYDVSYGTIGDSFETSGRTGISQFDFGAAVRNPILLNYFWTAFDNIEGDTKYWLARNVGAGTNYPVIDSQYQVFTRQDQFWFHPTDGYASRYMTSPDILVDPGYPSYLVSTDDDFATSDVYGLRETGQTDNIANLSGFAWKVDDGNPDWMILGGDGYEGEPEPPADVYYTGHHVMVMDLGDSYNTVYPKSGNNVDTGVGSIPRDDGVLASDGVQVLWEESS